MASRAQVNAAVNQYFEVSDLSSAVPHAVLVPHLAVLSCCYPRWAVMPFNMQDK